MNGPAMNEGRWILSVFGVMALLMIGLPVATILTGTRAGPPDQGLDGEVSKAFLTAGSASASPAFSSQPVPAVAAALPKGMPETTVFRKLAASGFTCATDSNAATCFRAHGDSNCSDDWNIRLIFKDDGTIWSTNANRKTTCL